MAAYLTGMTGMTGAGLGLTLAPPPGLEPIVCEPRPEELMAKALTDLYGRMPQQDVARLTEILTGLGSGRKLSQSDHLMLAQVIRKLEDGVATTVGVPQATEGTGSCRLLRHKVIERRLGQGFCLFLIFAGQMLVLDRYLGANGPDGVLDTPLLEVTKLKPESLCSTPSVQRAHRKSFQKKMHQARQTFRREFGRFSDTRSQGPQAEVRAGAVRESPRNKMPASEPQALPSSKFWPSSMSGSETSDTTLASHWEPQEPTVMDLALQTRYASSWREDCGLHPSSSFWNSVTKMMIRNIPARCQQEEVHRLIQEVTPNFRLQMPSRSWSSKCKGYAFVEVDRSSLRRHFLDLTARQIRGTTSGC
ncbi:unnamed protein product [Effrenium voratum]|uniref:RRM domain-containing protein n=1 Tax=Effrenium voratum TaxID=2562239 RepID=A0AA36HTV1_9DINO|nr:unnamed protein product [Effrenium voratum]